ncbi:hypothetical protein EZS27_035320, partial [termite gut metagenome]
MKKLIFGHVILGMAAIAGFSAVVMLLWNWLVPSIFGLTVINFWQALGLLALARLRFGGFGSKMAFGGHGRQGGGCGKNPIRERWEKMTPEERRYSVSGEGIVSSLLNKISEKSFKTSVSLSLSWYAGIGSSR